MARTQLLRQIARLYRNTARPGGGPTRRDFLKGSSVGALTLAASRQLSAKAQRTRVAIVGAGIAGLAAALTLEEAGFEPELFEASGRLGGRMHSDTVSWNNSQVSEHCGELIDSGHSTIIGLAQRFSLPLDDLLAAQPAGATETYFFGNRYFSASEAQQAFAPVYAALQQDLNFAGYPTLYNSFNDAALKLDRMSVYDWIQRRVPGGHHSPFGQLLDVAYNIEYGADTHVQSALNLVYLLGYQNDPDNFLLFGQSDEHFHIRGGNDRLPNEMAKALTRTNILTNMALETIEQESSGQYRLGFRHGQSCIDVLSRHVILALPFSVLRKLDYRRANFSPLKRKTIEQLGYGANAKLHLQFEGRPWNAQGPWGLSTGTTYSDTGYQNTWDVTRAQPGATGILVNYLGSTGGDLDTSEERRSIAARFLDQLEPVFPGITESWNRRTTLDVPLRNPWSLGSYSYFKVGQYTSICGVAGEPSANIHFAGEHCSVNYQGYMEGAAQEGIRAANEVIAAYP